MAEHEHFLKSLHAKSEEEIIDWIMNNPHDTIRLVLNALLAEMHNIIDNTSADPEVRLPLWDVIQEYVDASIEKEKQR
jgi:hypothetical protein